MHHAWRVRAAMLIGILTTTLLGLATGVSKWSPQAYRLGDLAATAGKLDIAGALRLGFLEIIFVFLFIDLFDNIGTLVAVGKKANLFDEARQIHLQFHPLAKALFPPVSPVASPSAIKAALNMLGFDVGGLRLPLTELPEAAQAKLRDLLATYQTDPLPVATPA